MQGKILSNIFLAKTDSTSTFLLLAMLLLSYSMRCFHFDRRSFAKKEVWKR